MLILADFSVIKPDFGLLFWTSVIFLLFWFLIGKLAFKPIANALKKREEDIQRSLDEAKRAREEMAKLKAENEELLAQAREERAKILKEAKEAAMAFEAEQREKTKEKMKKMLADAKEQIENQKMAAIVELKNEVGNMALEIAEKVIRQKLQGDKAQEELVKKLLEESNLS
ncbi:MAG: ATP synthase F0 subunit B [Bacteroidetes bacterium]|nr:MAG: ATP synthase F0 subunit B [Bacteroidota bacterium]